MSTEIDHRITEFIKKHHVFTLATSVEDIPWCAACFYAWHETERFFVYTTDPTTRHGTEATKNKHVAANIVLETRLVGKIQGLQISGVTFPAEGELEEVARKRYLKRFPYARLVDLNLWILEPQTLKLTDNNLGFGKKLIWQKDS